MTKLWNIATDLAINSNLNNLPEGALIPGEEGTPFERFPKHQASEWYYTALERMYEDQPEDGQDGSVGDHSAWSGSEDSGDSGAAKTGSPNFFTKLLTSFFV